MYKIKKKQYLSSELCNDICSLLDSGLYIKDCLAVLDDNKLINKMIDELVQGNLISDIICNYLSKDILVNYKSFIKYLDFNQSLKLSMEVCSYFKQIKQESYKKLIYPISMFLITIVGLILFSNYGYSLMVNMFTSFSLDYRNLEMIFSFINVLIIILVIFVISIFCCFILFRSEKYQIIIYIILTKYKLTFFLKDYYSNQFAFYLMKFNNYGTNTLASLEMINNCNDKAMLKFMAYHVDQLLQSGEKLDNSISNVYIDSKLAHYIKLSYFNNNLSEMLNIYIQQNKTKQIRFIKKLTIAIQLFSYIAIGLIIIVVYQILFIPLSIISKM